MAFAGVFQPGDRVQLTDQRRRHHTITLTAGTSYFTNKGEIKHDAIIGQPEGSVVTSSVGEDYLCFRHLMVDHILSMPRGAAVIYPKDIGQILVEGDIFPGARVLEAGAGSGALSMALLRAIGPTGTLYSYEIREDHLEFAQKNVTGYFGQKPDSWHPILGDLATATTEDIDGPVDRVVLDMVEPWTCLEAVTRLLSPGGVLMTYVPTVPQLMKMVESLRATKSFTEPRQWETLLREWHVEDLAVRPEHRMNAHTAFLIWARRLAPGVTPPRPKRRVRK